VGIADDRHRPQQALSNRNAEAFDALFPRTCSSISLVIPLPVPTPILLAVGAPTLHSTLLKHGLLTAIDSGALLILGFAGMEIICCRFHSLSSSQRLPDRG
jgi:membrane-bound ClpP family serine protease